MNIAFPALLIFLLILPGLLFNLSFYSFENTSPQAIPITHKTIVAAIANISLTNALRRDIGKAENFHSIAGAYLVLRYEEIKNLNIQFINIIEDDVAV